MKEERKRSVRVLIHKMKTFYKKWFLNRIKLFLRSKYCGKNYSYFPERIILKGEELKNADTRNPYQRLPTFNPKTKLSYCEVENMITQSRYWRKQWAGLSRHPNSSSLATRSREQHTNSDDSRTRSPLLLAVFPHVSNVWRGVLWFKHFTVEKHCRRLKELDDLNVYLGEKIRSLRNLLSKIKNRKFRDSSILNPKC